MINTLSRYTFLFLILIILQVLVFNNIQFSGYINPYVYIMFILLLPVEITQWILLLVAFFTGLAVDIFTGTLGMHAGATVAAGFVRPYTLRYISPRDGYEAGAIPSMFTYGFRWFFYYTSVVVFCHHLTIFYLEVFRFDDFLRTLLRVVLSSAFTISFILLVEYYRRGR